MDRVELTALVASLGLLVLVIELVRRRSLREEYSLLWLLMGGMILVLSLWRDLLHRFSELVGVYYPPSALFLLGFGIILLILLHFSTVISALTTENKTLAQRLALLTWRVEQLEGGAGQRLPSSREEEKGRTGPNEEILRFAQDDG